MITYDNIIRAFSTDQQTQVFHIKSHYTEVFAKMELGKFLHPDMLKIKELKQDLPFFKKFTISNLDHVLAVVFGPEKKLAKGDAYPEGSAEETKSTLSLIWQFIVESIEEQDTKNDFSRLTKIGLLAPIKDWALIPTSNDNSNVNSVKLAPIRDMETILNYGRHYTLQGNKLPVIKGRKFINAQIELNCEV